MCARQAALRTMLKREEAQKVQQQINVLSGEVSETKIAITAAEQAENGEKVRFLYGRLEKLDSQLVSLREEMNIVLRGQQRGEPRSPYCLAPTFHTPTCHTPSCVTNHQETLLQNTRLSF